MAALTPYKVVLVPGSHCESVERAVSRQSSSECLSLKGERSTKNMLPRDVERNHFNVEVVLPRELPIDLAGKSGVGVKTQILLQIDGSTIVFSMEVASRVRVVPTRVNLQLVLIEIFLLGTLRKRRS